MPITFLDDKKKQHGNGITLLGNADSAGIYFLDAGRNATGEEVTNRQASNPASAELMNRDDYVRMLEYKRDHPVSWGTLAINGAVGLADVAVGTIKELGGATRDAFNAPAPKGSISQLGVADLSRLNPVGEAAARGAYAGFNQLAGMALDMMTFNDDDLISYPQYLSANNLSDSAENKQKHELELNKQFEEFKRSQFAKAQTKDILEKSPLPATSEAVSLFAQPEFGIGALMARIGMGARVGRATAEAGSVVGKATQKLGKGLTAVSEMPKNLAVSAAEQLTENPRVASRVGSAVQTGTTGAVIAGMGGYAIPGVYEASKLITATRIAGEVLDVVGEVTKKISESAKAGTGRIGAFEALSQDLGASSSARTIGKIATLGGVDSITPYMSAALQGAAGGAVVGGTLGFLADGGEGMAAGVGMGLTLGAGGGLAGRGLQVASGEQRRSQIINDATKGVLNLSEASKGNAAKLFDSLIRRDGQEAVAELIDTTKWLNGAVKFEYITNEQAKSMPEAIGVGFEGITVAPKKGDVGTPTVFINIDRVNPGTGFHEGFHGAMRTALGDVYAPKFNELISKSFSQKEIDDFVSSYIDRAEDPSVKDVLKSYLEKKGNLPEEIGAEYFRQFLQQKENRDILLRGQRTTSGALINATKSAIDFSLNRLGVTQESYKTGYKGMDRLVTELIGARTAINKSIAKNGVPLAEVPLMKMPAEEVAVWAKTHGQSDVLLKDDAGNVIGVKTEDQVNLQRDLANTKAAADLADVPRGKNNLTDAELVVYQKYLSPEHFARLVYIVDAINTGKVINGDYFPATSKEGETSVYASRGMTTRDFVPYGIKVSKAGAISVMGLDMTQLRARFDDYMSRPGVDKLWDGNRDAALRDVQLYAENLSKGDAAVPSEQLFGKNKRDVLYKIFGFAPTKAILKSGGLVNPSSLGTNVRAESSAGPMQIGKPIDAYSNDTRLTTSFRLDRLGRVSDIGQSFQFNEGGSYKLSQVNFQVAEKIGSGEVWRSKDDQYKIIVKGNKHIVYNGNDKIGIFGNLADASSKIYKAEAKANQINFKNSNLAEQSRFMPTSTDEFLKAAVGDSTTNLNMKLAKRPGTGVARNEFVEFHDKVGRPIGIGADAKEGGKPFEVWKRETEQWLSDAEIANFRKWYRELNDKFVGIFGEKRAGTMMMAWLAAQQNVSPGGALGNVFKVEDRLAGIGTGKKGGLADEKIQGVLTQTVPEKGFGAKLTDFVDAGFLKKLRTYMGGDTRGGRPFVADVHTGRDSGHVDQQTLSRLAERSAEGDLFIGGKPAQVKITKTKTVKNGDKVSEVPTRVLVRVDGMKPFGIEIDMTGSPGGSQYEGISEWGNNLTDHLNKAEWKGGNWEPSEAQAVGWMRVLRQYGLAEPTVVSALAQNTSRLYAEVNYGSGATLNKNFPDFGKLSYNVQTAITKDVMERFVPMVAEKIGGSLRVQNISLGDGVFGSTKAPSVAIELLGSAEAVDMFALSLAHASEQAATMSAVFGTGGKDSRSLRFKKADGTKFTDSEINSLLTNAEISGFSVHQLPGGNEALITDAKADYTPKSFTEKKAQILFSKLTDWADKTNIALDVKSPSTKVTSYANNWSNNQEGQAYLDLLNKRGGASRIREVVGLRGQYRTVLEQSFDRHAPGVRQQGPEVTSQRFMPAMQFSAPENLPNGKVWRGENGYAIIQKEGGKFRVHSPIGLIGIAASYEAAEKMANKRNTR